GFVRALRMAHALASTLGVLQPSDTGLGVRARRTGLHDPRRPLDAVSKMVSAAWLVRTRNNARCLIRVQFANRVSGNGRLSAGTRNTGNSGFLWERRTNCADAFPGEHSSAISRQAFLFLVSVALAGPADGRIALSRHYMERKAAGRGIRACPGESYV